MKAKAKIGKNFVSAPSKFPKKFVGAKNPLLTALVKEDNMTLTENAAPTYKSSLNALVDLFAMGGALRSRSDDEVIQLFVKAFAENKLLAMKLLFNIRNIRGGAGERKVFRTILRWLGKNYPDVVMKNMKNVPFFGRWDDFYSLFSNELFQTHPGLEESVLQFIVLQLHQDVTDYENNKPISLLAKWMPSENTSSAKTRAFATKIRNYLGWNSKQYRKTLSVLRDYLSVVEKKMSANEWGKINYEQTPSKANLIYRKAFSKHDAERYAEFIAAVKKGDKKINASALYPYEIIEKIMYGKADEETMDVLWDALPDYMEDKTRNILVVADCSGSMHGRPMAVSVSLAIYTAEKNVGPFGGYFITFSESPTLQKIVGNNIREKMYSVNSSNWGYNTNLQKVFNMVLTNAVKNNIKQKDMPEQIIIVTDMEFDSPQHGGRTNVDVIKDKYAQAGYEMPQLVFWNARSGQNNVPATADEKGILLVSGASPSVFKTLLSGKQYTPEDQMLETLNQEMYNRVVI